MKNASGTESDVMLTISCTIIVCAKQKKNYRKEETKQSNLKLTESKSQKKVLPNCKQPNHATTQTSKNARSLTSQFDV